MNLPPPPTPPPTPPGRTPRPALQFLQRCIITMLGVAAAERVVNGIDYQAPMDLLLAALLLGTLNAFVRPIMLILSLPFLIFTLGLFILVINAGLLYFVGFLVDGFQVADFWSALKGAVIISLVSLFANVLLGTHNARFNLRLERHRGGRGPKPPSAPPPGSGPVIDV